MQTRSPAGQRREREKCSRLDQLVDQFDERDAGLHEERGKSFVLARQGASMGESRSLTEHAATEFQHDHRLDARGAFDGCTETPAVLGTFHDQGDHRCRLVFDHEIDIVGDVDDGLIADRDKIIQADAAVGREFGDGIQQAAALRDERNAAGNRCCAECPPWSRHSGIERSRCPCNWARRPPCRCVARARRAAAGGRVLRRWRHRRSLPKRREHSARRGSAASSRTPSTASAGTATITQSGTPGRACSDLKQGRPAISRIIRIDRPDRRRQSPTSAPIRAFWRRNHRARRHRRKRWTEAATGPRSSVFCAPSCMPACRQSMIRKRGSVKPSIGWSS